jgi:hypothetical protein
MIHRAQAEKSSGVRTEQLAERRITELRALPANQDRAKLIAELRKQISAIE